MIYEWGKIMEQNLDSTIKDLLSENIEKVILSNAKNHTYKKIVISKQTKGYMAEKFTEKQAFHETITSNQLECYCLNCMEDGFKQLNAWTDDEEISIKVSKKGKVFYNKGKAKTPVKLNKENNRKKKYYLEEGTVIPPLVDMGVFTKE